MTREEKLQAIEDMGIDCLKYCPDEKHIKLKVKRCKWFDSAEISYKCCEDCWINVLEGTT